MTSIRRREFLQLAALTTACAAVPRTLSAQVAPPRVVVVGGGFGGATVGKYLRHWGGAVDVTLVDPNPTHVACILSNGLTAPRAGTRAVVALSQAIHDAVDGVDR